MRIPVGRVKHTDALCHIYIKKHIDSVAEYIFGWREDLKRIFLEDCEWKIVRKVCFALLFANMELLTILRVLIRFVYQAWHPG